MPTRSPLTSLPPFDSETDEVNIIIETPKGSRNKYTYDQQLKLFKLKKVLPAGSTFPYDFGYIPSTKGEDGDPLDVLVLMDEVAFPGCYLTGRLIGVIRAEQTENGDTIRNDRLIAVASCSHDQHNIQSIDQLNQHLVKEIEHFFISYNEMEGKLFEPQDRLGPEKARKLVDKATVAKNRNGAVRHRVRK
jgi:inorganic pyrophosphatase